MCPDGIDTAMQQGRRFGLSPLHRKQVLSRTNISPKVWCVTPFDADAAEGCVDDRSWHTAAINQGALCPQLARADISPLDGKSGHDVVDGAGSRRPFKVVAIALANKMARVAWVLLARGGTYRVPALAAA
jgi:hypothetical protein